MNIPTTKDPNRNSMINPNRNRMINPNINSMINPNRNSMINPNRNSMINPNRNSMINPNRNSIINPNRNSIINPNRNSMINPNRNSMINPNRTYNYQGLFVFNMNLSAIEFIIDTNHQNVIQFFDQNLLNTRFGVRHSQNGYVLFDLKMTYIGHLESDGKNGYNEFGLNNEWKGIIK